MSLVTARKLRDDARHRRSIQEESDAALLARVRGGDISALGVLYDRHHESVHRFVLRATGTAPDAEDVTQEAFLALARIAERFDGRESARPLLLGIAAKLLLVRRRRLARWTDMLSSLWHASGARSAPSPEGVASATEELRRFEQALLQLPPGKRVVVLMVDAEGMSGEEVARALELPVGTVWTRLHYARARLREALGPPSG